MSKRVTVPEVMAAKGKRKLTELTAYDYPTALWADKRRSRYVAGRRFAGLCRCWDRKTRFRWG